VVADRSGYVTVFNVGPPGDFHLLYADEARTASTPPMIHAGVPLRLIDMDLEPQAGREWLFAVWTRRPFSKRCTPFSQERLMTSKEWYEKAYRLGCERRYVEAIECWKQVAKLEPRNAEAWRLQAYAYQEVGDNEMAIRCYDRALEILPGYAEALKDKAVTLCRMGREKEAFECMEQANKNGLFDKETDRIARLKDAHGDNWLDALVKELGAGDNPSETKRPKKSKEGWLPSLIRFMKKWI